MGTGPPVMNVIAIGAGIVVAFAVLAAAVDVPPPGFPTRLLSGGSTVTIPAFHHAMIGGNSTCGGSPCGSPGELWLEFPVTLQARLSGSLRAEAPMDLWVGNALGMEAACDLSNPPPPCVPIAESGPSYLYQGSISTTGIDFGQLVFDFGGAGRLLPSGTWTILLINWGDATVEVTANSDVIAMPVW